MIALDIDFRTIFAPFSDPRSDEIGPQRCPNAIRKKTQKNIAFGSFGVDFALILGLNLDPGGSAKAVFGTFCALGALLGGRWPQDAPRALPRPILDRFW